MCTDCFASLAMAGCFNRYGLKDDDNAFNLFIANKYLKRQ